MKRLIPLLILALTLVPAVTVRAETLSSPERAMDLGNRLMITIARNRLDEAWQIMKQHSTIPPGSIDAFAEGYRQRLDRNIRHYGAFAGVELIESRQLGQSLLKLTYYVKYEVTGVGWFLIFYKSPRGWVLSEFNYDINSETVFDETSAGESDGESRHLVHVPGWQEELEKRLGAIEEQLRDLSAQHESSEKTRALLRSTRERLDRLEQELAAIGADGASDP